MPLDLNSYRQRLDRAQQAAGVRSLSGIGANPQTIDIGAAPQAPDMSMVPSAQAGAGPSIGAPVQAAQARRREGPLTPNDRRMGKGQAKESLRPTFDADKLDSVKTPGDLIEAMPKKEQNRYLNAWEAQHGAIQEKYQAILQEMGQRPDPKRKVDRKEMFGVLMEFGLNLMKNSQVTAENPQGDDGDGAINAIGASITGLQQDRQIEARRHDVIGSQVRSERDAELKGIGSYPQAVEKQGQEDLRDSQIAKNNAYVPPGKTSRKQILTTDQGVMDIGGDVARPVIGEDGKPLTRTKIGAGGGRIPDTRPSEQKKYEHLISLGVPTDSAKVIAYRQATGDPRKDYAAIYREMLKATMGDTEAAKKASDEYMQIVYDDGAIEDSRTPLINKGAPKRRVYEPGIGFKN